jgi:hypothetical protein
LESATGASDRSFADLKDKERPCRHQGWRQGNHSSKPFFEAYFSVQTFMDFMPVSASVLVLNVPLSTTVVVEVVGFLSTTEHFLVEASRTT